MKKIRHVVVLLLFLFWIAEPGHSLTLEGKEIFDSIRKYVYQIKISADEEGAKQSYGSGFVVGEEGLLVTNYHVVSSALNDKDYHYSVFVVDEDKNIRADIIDINVVNDLALIRIDRRFDGKLELKKNTPRQGEKIYSLGLPKDINISIIEGTYNGIVEYGVYKKIHMSSPLNSGMSGGPTVDSEGEAIGVNVSTRIGSQNISFCVPIALVQTMMDNYLTQGEGFKQEELNLYVRKQLFELQTRMFENLGEKTEKNNTLGSWTFAYPPKETKCWGKKSKDDKNSFFVEAQTCRPEDISFIKDGLYVGTYSLRYYSIESLTRNTLQFYHVVNNIYNKFSFHYYSGKKHKKDRTFYRCHEDILVNKNGIPFKYRYCMKEFLDYPQLYQIDFKMVSLLKEKKAFVVGLKLNGVSQSNIVKFLQNQIDNINFRKPDDRSEDI